MQPAIIAVHSVPAMSTESLDPVTVSRDLLDERRALLAEARRLIARRRDFLRRLEAAQSAQGPSTGREVWVWFADPTSIKGHADWDGEADAARSARPA
jgi:hypothetical protein